MRRISGANEARAAWLAGAALGGGLLAALPVSVMAQTAGEIIKPILPPDYMPYQERSATEQDREPWAALGIDAGGFRLYPSIAMGMSATDNAYQVTDKTGSAIAVFAPRLEAKSNWSRHSLQVAGSATLNRYIGNARRNETTWAVLPEGTLDIDSRFSLTAKTGFTQQAINRFSGELINDAASVSIVRQQLYSLALEYTAGSFHASLKGEHREVRHKALILLDGMRRDQSILNHGVDAAVGHFDYSLSPDFIVFGEVSWSKYDFVPSPTVTIQNSGSSGIKVEAGARVSAVGLGRATVATSYAWRDYEAAGITPVQGASAMALLEFFPSALTTVSFEAGHRFTDVRLLDSNVVKANYIQAKLDHALLRNLILNVTGEASKWDYVKQPQATTISRLAFNASYYANRWMEVKGTLAYGTRRNTPRTAQSNVKELAGGVTATFKL